MATLRKAKPFNFKRYEKTDIQIQLRMDDLHIEGGGKAGIISRLGLCRGEDLIIKYPQDLRRSFGRQALEKVDVHAGWGGFDLDLPGAGNFRGADARTPGF